jgi:hypothetical protein
MQLGLRGWLGLGLAAALLLLMPVASRAADTEPVPPGELSASERAELQAQYDKLFAELLKRPADLDLMFAFAGVAARLGKYEAAISTLERMLLFSRNLPRVKAELGILYFRLGSYAIAKNYLQAAIAGKDVPEGVKQRVDFYLAQIEKRTATNHIAGSVTTGFRYQTNANVGPSTNQVLAFGVPAILNNTFVSQSDWNWFASGYGVDSYDLNPEKTRTWDTTFQGYYAQQFQLTNLNLGFGETTTGPRFFVNHKPGSELSFRPFVLANIVGLGGAVDFYTAGGGFEMDKAFDNDRVFTSAGYTFRYQWFENSDQFPTNSLFTGPVNTGAANLRYQLTDTIQLGVAGYMAFQDSQADFDSNRQYSIVGDISKSYAAPFGLTHYPWYADLAIRGIFTDYEAPDPTVNPLTARADQTLQLTFTNTMGITKDLSLLLQAQYTNNDSNLPNFSFVDTSVLMGLTFFVLRAAREQVPGRTRCGG